MGHGVSPLGIAILEGADARWCEGKYWRRMRSTDRATFIRQIRAQRAGLASDRQRDLDELDRSSLGYDEIAANYFELKRTQAGSADGSRFSIKAPGYNAVMGASISARGRPAQGAPRPSPCHASS